jgi:MFS family permease
LGGISTGIIFPVGAILIPDLGSEDYHGFNMGCFEFGMGIGMIFQTAISGVLGEMGGANLTYLFAFITFVIAIPISMKFIYDKQDN